MGILEDELQELKKIVVKLIADSTLEACVPAMVRVNIQRTKYKQMVVCFQFTKEYPSTPALIELKSHHVSKKLLDGLEKLCEEEARKYLGKPQVLATLKFVRSFIDENPLLCCSEEISSVKKKLHQNTDEIKLKQKTSTIILILREGEYFMKYYIAVPDNYPDKQISIELKESNFPPVFDKWMVAQSIELARQCIQPPARRKPKDPPFQIKPSLGISASFLIEEAHKYPAMECKYCGEKCFPSDPKDVEHNDANPKHVERVFCGHIYHNFCLDTYIRTPPFTGGKKCLVCNARIFHDKWKVTSEVAEARWAHKQAKQREIDEVVDFMS